MILAALLALVVGTWNGNWFPSGRAEHRAHPDVEKATIAAAGRMIRGGLDRLDPMATNDIILCCNEIRGPRVAKALAEAIGRKGLVVASVSGYRRRDRFDQQQDVILTTLPVAQGDWGVWREGGKDRPPRGWAHAEIVLEPAVTAAVYAVHLKSNYGSNGKPELKAANRRKRSAAVRELLALLPKGTSAARRPVLVAGDFNADAWRAEFSEDTIFADFTAAGFANPLARLPPKARGTRPNRRWGDSALDYVMVRGLACEPPILIPAEELSDHCAVLLHARTTSRETRAE